MTKPLFIFVLIMFIIGVVMLALITIDDIKQYKEGQKEEDRNNEVHCKSK